MKLILALIFLLVGFSQLFANQIDALYDVNYDSPVKTQNYDEKLSFFYNAYLQYELAIKNVKELERNNYEIKLSQELENQRKEIYASEISSLRELEKTKMAEELKKNISKELYIQFDESFKQKTKDYAVELRNQIEAEYERNLQVERLQIEKELRKKIHKEDGIIQKAIIAALIVFFVLLFLHIVKSCRRRSKKCSLIVDEYLTELKSFDGKETAIEKKREISESIDEDNLKDDEKELRKDALRIAWKLYEKSKEIKDFIYYREQFEKLQKNVELYFTDWNGNSDDLELRKGLCNSFFSNIGEWRKTLRFAVKDSQKSNSEKDMRSVLDVFSYSLRDFSSRIANLRDDDGLNKFIRKQLRTISKKYMRLSKGFAR